MVARMLGLVALMGLSAGRLAFADSVPATQPHDTSAWIGSNYTPAYAVNQVQMWHDFRPEVIERELSAAHRLYGINSLRVYLHNIVYDAEKEKLLDRIEQFLKICDRNGIKPGFTFFDDCWNHKDIQLESKPPVDGRHNGRWAALQDAQRKDENLPNFKSYVQDIIRPHREDPRVRWWEIYNEPGNDPFTHKIRQLGYGWAKELNPVQPVLACWDEHPFTDIVNSHSYTDDYVGDWAHRLELNPKKGTVFTEAGARWYAQKPISSGAPIEVIHWLRSRRDAGKLVPGVYLCWELMVGNSNCRWYWGTPDGAPEPSIPWCGLMWPDCTPVSYAEAEAIRSYATGQKRAMLFQDFQDLPEPVQPELPGWKRFGGEQSGGGGSRCLKMSGTCKMIAGDAAWTDYLLEGTVMLKGGGGNAGLVFRVNDPGPGGDQMRGYYIGFDERTLYLGKMLNDWRPLATVDLTKRPNPPKIDSWNMVRVAVQGNRIRVWFNPVHDQTGPLLDVKDEEAPLLAGSVGVRTAGPAAWFDDVVVLPLGVLDEATAGATPPEKAQ